MCLSVYLGTNIAVDLPSPAEGQLGIELASWKPPPLHRHEFVYFLGRKGKELKLECSCLFAEHVVWTEDGAVASSDALYPEDGPCPFDQLRTLCATATKRGGWATIVSDDSNGLEQPCTAEDYCSGVLPLHLIKRGNLLFAEVTGIPWKVWHVVANVSAIA
jgi:hypothetical protein